MLGVQAKTVEAGNYVVSWWTEPGPACAAIEVSAALAGLISRPRERLVLDLSALAEIEGNAAEALARCLLEAQRHGKQVCLVRCPGELYRRLRDAGLQGDIQHAVSVGAATQGLVGDATGTLEFHLRSLPALLQRLRRVLAHFVRHAGVSADEELQIKTAVTEAVANAMLHGSPDGARNHVRVAVHLDEDALVVDVADQGPGFDPGVVQPACVEELCEAGYGLQIIRKSVDRVEFFQDDRGMLVRLTKYLRPREAGWAR